MADLSYRAEMTDTQIRQEQSDLTTYLTKDIGFTFDDLGTALKLFTLEDFTAYVDEQLPNRTPAEIIAKFRREYRADTHKTMLAMLGFKSAAAIVESDVQPPEFIVDDILPIGLAVLNGAPKTGKSLLAMQLALAVANGTEFLGRKTHKADVVYFDLESRNFREKSRLLRMTDGEQCPDNLHIDCDAELNGTKLTIAQESLNDAIKQIHDELPTAKLFIIDTFSRARGNINTNGRNAYDVDVELLSPLQKLAVTENICIMLIHHLKKGSDRVSDITEMSSGTMGIPGTADTNLYYANVDSTRMNDHRTLKVRPRDAEEQDITVVFNKRTLTVSVDDAPTVDVMGMPLAKWCIDNCPERNVSDVFPYQQMYREAYNCNDVPDNVGDRIIKLLTPVQAILSEQYGVYVHMKQKSGSNRGVKLIPYQPAM